MAISVPPPMEIPTSAAASAGASFTPSPTIATGPLLLRRISAIASPLPPGRMPPRACAGGMLRSWATAFTTSWRSPLMIHDSMPRVESARIAAALSGRTVSARLSAPADSPLMEMKSGVRPAAASVAAQLMSSGLVVAVKASVPMRTVAPSMLALTPCPACIVKSVAVAVTVPAARTIARASGCSDGRSTAAAI